MSEAEVPISADEGHRMLSLGFFNFSIVRRSFLFDFFFFYEHSSENSRTSNLVTLG